MTKKNFSLIFLSAFLSLATSCATQRTTPVESSTPGAGESEAGPVQPGPAPITGDEQKPSYGPDLPEQKAVVLAFGPGQARAFAYVGVLRALAEAKIKISAVAGVEMGAVIAASFAMTPTINQFDWRIQQLKEKINSASLLNRIFKQEEIQSARIPLRIGVGQDVEDYPSDGKITELLASSFEAAARFPVDEARHLAPGLVIFVDIYEAHPTQDEAETNYQGQLLLAKKKMQSEIEKANVVIRVPLKGLGYFDFAKRKEIEYRGRQAATKKISEIKSKLISGSANGELSGVLR